MSLAAKIARVPVELPQRMARENLPKAAKILHDAVQTTLGVSGTRSHPSAPGEAPHRVDGALQAGSGAKPDPAGNGVIVYTTPVGKILNAGTRDGRIKPRPWLRIALASCRDAFRAALLARPR